MEGFRRVIRRGARSILLLVVALGPVPACGDATRPPVLGATAAPAPSPSPSASTVPPPSNRATTRPYSQVLANSARSSRISAPRVVPVRIEKFAALPTRPADSYPRFVLPARRSDFALTALDEFPPITLDSRGRSEVASSSTLRSLVIGDDGYDDGSSRRAWGAPPPGGARGVDAVATWIEGARGMRVVAVPGGEARAQSGGLVAWDGDKVWKQSFEGEVFGAISGAVGAVVVEDAASKVHLYPPPFGSPGDAWTPRWTSAFVGGTGERGSVYEASVLEDGVALVVDTMPRGGMGAALRQSQDRPTWSSAVIVFDLDGRQRYRLDVPWSIAMPVLDAGPVSMTGPAGPRRIALAGSMLAVYEDGKELWRREGGPVRATAYEDGALVVTQGDALIALARDGAELGRVRAPDGEPFTTPPAVAEDGSIWAATSQSIWVARGAR